MDSEVAEILSDAIYEGPVSTSFAGRWKIIPIDVTWDGPTINIAHRLNALGSSFYFTKVVLRRNRLNNILHKMMCDEIECDYLKRVIEIPRDHFKSTVYSEGGPMWWALPFLEEDESLMRSLGFGDEWIRWMHRAHNPNTRNLLISENITNAVMLGIRIAEHYANNDFFRGLFPCILPDSSCKWKETSYVHKRNKEMPGGHGEGTYDFLGVGGALQSRHYDRVIQDDLVGRDALNSETVMNGTIEYHRLLVGAFDSDPTKPDNDNDEIICGNRWAFRDLNSYIRGKEKRFQFVTHSAVGGCCEQHPYGTPIFSEEFSLSKLEGIKERLGTYHYSCQYLNKPVPPEDRKFKESWLRYYTFGRDFNDPRGVRIKIVHEVSDGRVIPDILPGHLQRRLICDPNHSGEEGRCNHAIGVFGVNSTPTRIYLLDVWAQTASFSDLVEELFSKAEKWKLHEIYLETIAAQKYLKFYLETANNIRRSLGKWTIDKVHELSSKTSANAKQERIDALEPVLERGEFWVNRIGSDQFLEEYRTYSNPIIQGQLVDILDIVGYSIQVMSDMLGGSIEDRRSFIQRHREMARRGLGVTGY